jgi:hypothetical protein
MRHRLSLGGYARNNSSALRNKVEKDIHFLDHIFFVSFKFNTMKPDMVTHTSNLSTQEAQEED